MHVRGGSQWKKTERRDNSIGPLRRAHPASGKILNFISMLSIIEKLLILSNLQVQHGTCK